MEQLLHILKRVLHFYKKKIIKGHNHRGKRNDVMFTLLHFVQLMYGTSALWIISIIQEFSSTTGSNEEMMNLL